MKENKVNVIYIGSNGRSGSTILEMLLTSSDQMWTLGEVQLLELENKINAVDGSGNVISSSPFWGDIVKNVNLKNDYASIAHFRKTGASGKSHHGKVLRAGHLSRMAGICKNKTFTENYNTLNLQLYKESLKNARLESGENVKYLIDSSKDPYRLFYLSCSSDINLHSIQIIKHPSSFIYSQVKDSGGLGRFLKVLRYSVRWVAENQIICWAGRKVQKSIVVSYKDLAQSTSDTLREIDKALDIQNSEYELEGISEFVNYGISGNMSRFKSDKIIYDERWISGMRSYEKRIITIICGTFAPKLFQKVR